VAGTALAGFVILGAVLDALVPKYEVHDADAQKLADSLKELGTSGKSTGEVLRLFGPHLERLAKDMRAVEPAIKGAVDQFTYFLGLRNLQGGWDVSNLLGDKGGTELQAELDKASAAFEQARKDIEGTDKALSDLARGGSAEQAANAAGKLLDAWLAAGGTLGEFRKQFPDTIGALRSYATGSASTVDATGRITNGFGEATTAADLLKASIDALNGVQLTEVQAHIQFTDALAKLRDAASDGKRSLDLNTEAGADNAQAFVNAALKAQAFGEAVGDTQGIEAGRAALGQLRQQIIDQAKDAGFDADQVGALIDQIFRVPADTQTAVNLHDNATAGIQGVNAWLDRIDGKSANVSVFTTYFQQTLGLKPAGTPTGKEVVGLPPIPGGAQGGRFPKGYAGGGSPFPGDLALVGERGPELVRFGGSGYVTPADLTAHALAAAQAQFRPAPSPYGSPVAAPAAGSTTVIHRTFAPVFQMTAARPVTAREAMDVARDYEWLHGG
jgi:hypothetical protein